MHLPGTTASLANSKGCWALCSIGMQVFGWQNTFFFSVLITSCLGLGRKAPRLQITWPGAIQSGPRPCVWAIYYYIKWLDSLFFQLNELARCLSYFYIHYHYVPLEIKVRSSLITICLDCVVSVFWIAIIYFLES